MYRILVPTDFSPNANCALEYAAKIASKLNAEILLLHAYSLSYKKSFTIINLENLPEEFLKIEAERIKRKYPKVNFIPKCIFANATKAITEICEEEHIDLIIMGAIGKSHKVEKIFGDITISIINKTTNPIIIVPLNTPPNIPKNILIANDFSHKGDESIFEPINDLSEALSSEIYFINIIPTKKVMKEQQKMTAEFDQYDDPYHQFQYKVNNDTEEKLIDFTNKNKTDLIVLIKHQYKFWREILHNSLTKSMAKHSQIPLFILNDKS